MVSVKIPEKLYEQIRNEIKHHSPNEACMFLIAKRIEHPFGTTYAASKIILLEDDEANRNPTHCSLRAHATSDIFTWFLREKYHLRGFVPIYIHSHPFVKDRTVTFSSIDFRGMREDRAKLYDKYFGDMEDMWIVFNEEATKFDGRVVRRNGDYSQKVHELVIYGKELKKIFAFNKAVKTSPDLDFYHRMSLIPGINLKELKNIRIGIVGLGGNGASILQGILMTGLGEDKELVLIDHDKVEASNLSRIPYAHKGDIGKYKVEVAEDYVKRIRPTREVISVKSKSTSEEAMKYLKGCDLIIGAVDSELARYHLNYFSTIYHVPLFDTGAGVVLNKKTGKVASRGGQLRIYIPYTSACLECNMGINKKAVEAELPWKDSYLQDERVREEVKKLGYFNVDIGPQPSVYTLNALVSILTIDTILKWANGGINYDALSFELAGIPRLMPIVAEKREQCNICGTNSIYRDEIVTEPTIEMLFDKNEEEEVLSPEESLSKDEEPVSHANN